MYMLIEKLFLLLLERRALFIWKDLVKIEFEIAFAANDRVIDSAIVLTSWLSILAFRANGVFDFLQIFLIHSLLLLEVSTIQVAYIL